MANPPMPRPVVSRSWKMSRFMSDSSGSSTDGDILKHPTDGCPKVFMTLLPQEADRARRKNSENMYLTGVDPWK